MVKVPKFLVVYALTLIISYALMPITLYGVHIERGYFTIGGEWFLPFVIVGFMEAIRLIVRFVARTIKEIKKEIRKGDSK